MINLDWSPWVPFVGGDFRSLPRGPGLYRVRSIGAEHMAYIGQTGRDLRQRLASLRLNTLATDMPFNDPHTAGPSLWVWLPGVNYLERSATTIVSGAVGR